MLLWTVFVLFNLNQLFKHCFQGIITSFNINWKGTKMKSPLNVDVYLHEQSKLLNYRFARVFYSYIWDITWLRTPVKMKPSKAK